MIDADDLIDLEHELYAAGYSRTQARALAPEMLKGDRTDADACRQAGIHRPTVILTDHHMSYCVGCPECGYE